MSWFAKIMPQVEQDNGLSTGQNLLSFNKTFGDSDSSTKLTVFDFIGSAMWLLSYWKLLTYGFPNGFACARIRTRNPADFRP